MSKKIKDEQKKFLGETLNQYDKALNEGIDQLDKKNREQNHKISSLVNSFDNEFLEKDVEGTMISLENSKDGMVIIDEIAGNSEVNYCKDGVTELTLNGDIDTQGESSVTITEGVDGGLVDVVIEGNTEINMSNTKDPVMVTHMFDEFTNNGGKLQTTVDDVTTYDSMVGKIDIKNIKGDTLVNHAVNGNEELILNGDIDTSGDNFITINTCAEGGKVDVALEGNTLVNVSKTKDTTPITHESEDTTGNHIALADEGSMRPVLNGNTLVNVCDQKDPITITKSYTVETGNHVALQGEYDGKCRPVVTGNTLWIDNDTEEVITAFDDTKNLRLQSSFEDKVVTQEMVDAGEELAENLGKYKVDYVITGKNKFDGELELGDIRTSTGENRNNSETQRTIDKIKVNPNTAYSFSNSNNTIPSLRVYDKVGNYLTYVTVNQIATNNNFYTTPYNGYYIRLVYNTLDSITNIQIEEGTEATSYEPYKEYKKTFYLNSPLLEGDTIEQQGNNVVHVHRYSKAVLDGSGDENWATQTLADNTCLGVYLNKALTKPNQSTLVYCDKFPSKTTDHVTTNPNLGENVFLSHTGKININILKSKLSTENISGFKQWLQSNPTTVVYKLATPQYEVISQNDTILCDSYVNGHLDVDSVVPIEKVDFTGVGMYLRYLYPSTKYAIQFEADNDGKINASALNDYDSITNLPVNKGINKFNITTDDTIRAKYLWLDGIGFNASNIVVTPAIEQDFNYFSGMQSCFEDNLVTEGENAGKYKVEYKVSDSEGIEQYTKTLYLNSPLLEGDTIEEKDGNIYHVHRYNSKVYETGDENTYITDLINTVCPLETPQYELIQQSDTIAIPTYSAGHLDVTTAVPVGKVNFLHFEEELTYLYPSTQYTIQFNSDNAITVDITLGGKELLAQSIVSGLNKMTITTPETLVDNKLIIDGVGANISEVVVTNTDREFGYFEGMKSVGECEDLEVVSNNKNLFNYTSYSCIGELPMYGSVTLSDNIFHYVGVDNSRVNYGLLIKGVHLRGNTQYTISYSMNPINSSYTKGHCRIFTRSLGSILSESPSGKVTFTTDSTGEIRIAIYGTVGSLANCEFEVSNIQIEEGSTSTDYIPHAHNTQTLTHEPLRSVGEDIKDKYVLIDGKWYIERNCGETVFNGSDTSFTKLFTGDKAVGFSIDNRRLPGIDNTTNKNPENTFKIDRYRNKLSGKWDNETYWAYRNPAVNLVITFPIGTTNEQALQQVDGMKVVYRLASPQYEPIDYDPFAVYSDVTHISNNSTIPANMVIKNTGYNMVALKENTSYTLYVDKNTTNALTYRLGDYVEINSLSKFTFTTPATLTNKTLRITGKGNSVKDLMLIEGTPANDPVGYFDGLKSSYECEKVTDESDENYGKYKVEVVVRGKNLYDINKLIEGYTVLTNGELATTTNTNLATIKLNVLNLQGKSLIKRGGNRGYYRIEDNNGNKITYGNSTTISIPYGAKTLYWYVSTDRVTEVQIEEGTIATEYEPYFESKQTVYLNSPLLKGDEIVWKDNKIQHYHKMGSVVLDGSDDEGWILNVNNNYYVSCWTEIFISTQSTPFICDKFTYKKWSDIAYSNYTECVWSSDPTSRGIMINKSRLSTPDLQGFKQWLQQNPTIVVYELETPYYEEISPYPLKFNTKENCSLTTESNIQVTQISFNIYEETLAYLYPSTKYYVSFNADISREIVVDLGGTKSRFTTQVGYNKIEITTPADTTNMLTFNGQGINIDHVMVTRQDIDEYFEGMKSVGECENNTLEIICKNNDNSKSNTQTLTHEPLRSVGNIKDKYVLIDGKWYIERNTKEVMYNDSGNETWVQNGRLDVYYRYMNNGDTSFATSSYDLKCDTHINHTGGISKGLFTTSTGKIQFITDIPTLSKFKTWLSNNPKKIVCALSQPTYEPIDYNPFEVYSDVTHISNNSLIPSNMVIKNHGYNTILKPSTTYTVALNKSNGTIGASLGGSSKVESSNNIFTITTPSTLTDDCLRLYGKGIKSKDVMILEGDKTNYIPGYFEGLESVFEQEYDEEKGKYKVRAKIVGKNLFGGLEFNNTQQNKYSWYKITNLEKGKTYTFTASEKVGDNTILLSCYPKYSNGNYVTVFNQYTDNIRTIKNPYDGNSCYIGFYNHTSETTKMIQIEQGTQATPYEPYKENYIGFYIDEPLRGIGNTKDKVYVKDDKVVVERNCGSVTLDGVRVDRILARNQVAYSSFLIRVPGMKASLGKNKTASYNDKFKTLTVNEACTTSILNSEYIYHNDSSSPQLVISVLSSKLQTQDVVGFKKWLQQNPTTVVYERAEPVYEEADCDLSKLVLENYPNSSLILDTNIPSTVDVRYSGEVPIVSQAKTLSSQVDNTTLDINENIIPYMCDIDYRIVELQLMNGDTQGEGIELLGIGDIEILGNENVLFNNREDKKYNYSYDMLKRDILSQRYSKEEYQYRLDRYLLANKISDEEYKELEGLLNNGE